MLRARKNQFSVPVLAMTTLLLAPAAAHADILATSPLWADGQSYHACIILNYNVAVPVDIRIELMNTTGGLFGFSDVRLGPFHTAEFNDNNGSGGTSNHGFAWCRFIISSTGAPIRANMTIFHSLSNGFQTYATSEAR
jgi:hypothetical protein